MMMSEKEKERNNVYSSPALLSSTHRIHNSFAGLNALIDQTEKGLGSKVPTPTL